MWGMAPRISVVTATLNRCEFLRRAVESVIAQGLEGIEHIVIDGMSADGTQEILRSYSHLVAVSERDNGLYEAWNKGIARATGDLICILNDDDEIPAGAFARARAALQQQPNLELLSGPVELCSENSDGTRSVRIIDDYRILSLREQDVGPGVPITNGRYFLRHLLHRIGPFDERYKLVSDRVFLLSVILAAPNHVIVEQPLYRYHVHSQSLTMRKAVDAHRLSAESWQAARDGFAEATTPAAHAAYGRWQAWGTLYLAGLETRQAHYGAAAKIAARTFKSDPFWLLRTVAPVLRHVRERRARRGRLVKPQ